MNIHQEGNNITGSGLGADLMSLCEDIAAAMPLADVDHIYVPPSQERGEKARKFGLVVLNDQSTGFFFTLLDSSGGEARSVLDGAPRGALELARWFESDNIAMRAVGLGAIGAITQSFFTSAGFRPEDAINPIANLRPVVSDHIGMVGYFPGLVKRLRKQKIRLTVLELDEKWVQADEGFEVTLDPARLAECNKILCTASTLINDTVDDILRFSKQAGYLALIGPSAGCLPDPLFARGVDVVGGSAVISHARLETCCESGEDWGDSVRKYCLTPDNYPGTSVLIDRLAYAPGR